MTKFVMFLAVCMFIGLYVTLCIGLMKMLWLRFHIYCEKHWIQWMMLKSGLYIILGVLGFIVTFLFRFVVEYGGIC